MNQYPLLKDILPIYSASFGYDEELEDDLLLARFSGESKDLVKQELEEILTDNNISLVEFLDMDGIEAYSADDEGDAREFLVERIWGVLFSSEDLPRD